MILGAGVQGTLYAVRLVRVGHDVTVIARGMRAAELRRRVAHIEEALTSRTDTVQLPVKERLSPDVRADVCLVAVRREQIREVLPDLAAAVAIRRVVFMVNHANGSKASRFFERRRIESRSGLLPGPGCEQIHLGAHVGAFRLLERIFIVG
jgi:ketopantoate reductase